MSPVETSPCCYLRWVHARPSFDTLALLCLARQPRHDRRTQLHRLFYQGCTLRADGCRHSIAHPQERRTSIAAQHLRSACAPLLYRLPGPHSCRCKRSMAGGCCTTTPRRGGGVDGCGALIFAGVSRFSYIVEVGATPAEQRCPTSDAGARRSLAMWSFIWPFSLTGSQGAVLMSSCC